MRAQKKINDIGSLILSYINISVAGRRVRCCEGSPYSFASPDFPGFAGSISMVDSQMDINSLIRLLWENIPTETICH